MQVIKIKEEKLKREYDVTIPATDIKDKVNAKLANIAMSAKLPGFRQGKAPLQLIERNYGKSVKGEVLEEVIRHTSTEALQKEGLNPATQPQIEVVTFEDNNDLKYKLKFEIFPEIPEIDFKKIKLTKLVAEVNDDEIQENIKTIAGSYKDFTEAEEGYKSAKGDSVVIDFVGKVNGEPFEGGTENDFQLELGSGNTIPGFEDQLTGLKKGDEKILKVTFPKDYHSKKIAGKDAEFEAKVKQVLIGKELEINDEFAKKLGMENIEQLKEAAKKQMETDFEAISKNLLKKQLFDELEKLSVFDLPDDMVKLELRAIVDQAQNSHKHSDHEHDDHDHSNCDHDHSDDEKTADKPTKDDLEKKYKKIAERRVRLGVLLSETAQKNEIQVGEEDLKNSIMAMASAFPGREQEVVSHYTQNPNNLNELKGPIIEEKAVDFILKQASIEEKQVSSKELVEEANNLHNFGDE